MSSLPGSNSETFHGVFTCRIGSSPDVSEAQRSSRLTRHSPYTLRNQNPPSLNRSIYQATNPCVNDLFVTFSSASDL